MFVGSVLKLGAMLWPILVPGAWAEHHRDGNVHGDMLLSSGQTRQWGQGGQNRDPLEVLYFPATWFPQLGPTS